MTATTLATAVLVINELMAANVGTALSPAINYDSWIELYNPGDEAVDLGGLYLSDDTSNLKLWQMPGDMGSVPAKGFKVVWLGSNDIKATQAPFKLDCDGGTIIVSDGKSQLCRVDYPAAMSRTAWARKSDGSSVWGWTADATPGATNATAVFATKRLDAPVVSQGSCLFDGSVQVSIDIPEGATLMYTTDGSVPTAPAKQGQEASPWTEWVKNGDCEGDDVTCLIGKNGDENGKFNTYIVDGAGYDNTRGIKVHAVAGAAEEWDTQFFVYTPDHIWNAGDKYRFHMRIRADRACKVNVQSHKTPGNYIYWDMLGGSYNVSTEWMEIDYEGTITNEQAGSTGGGGWWGWGEPTPSELQTIAFNLNVMNDKDNNFYIDDVSWQSFTGEGETTDVAKESKDGQFTFTKTTNFCARLFKDGYLPSVPVTRSYIKTSNSYTLPVISIVGDPKYFTDPKIGIDCDGDGTNGKTGNGQDFPRNYNQDWDRPVNFSYLSPEGEMLFNQDVNISVSGGWTRSQRNKSFKLKSNKVFDGQNRFDFSFFEQKPYTRNKAVLVRNGGNDVWTHSARFMDPALETIIFRSGIDLDVQAYEPVIEYVNGQLRGLLNLRETNNDKFVYANWGYDDEEIDALENFEMKNGTDEVINRIFELGTHINDAGVYDELCQLLDIDEFTNYMATELFLANDDWPNNNIKGYRSQAGGRYRFVSFDLDYAFNLCGNNTSGNPFTFFAKFSDMDFVNFFINLLKHDEYRRKFIDTFCIIGGSVFEPKRAGAVIDELLARVKPMNQLMQQQGTDANSPERSANTIKSNLNGRSATLTGYMQRYSPMKLGGVSSQKVNLSVDAEDAHLYVNGIDVPSGGAPKASGKWTLFDGVLFAPVELEAKAPYGYVFAGWKKGNDIISTDPVINLPEGNSVSLTATFTALVPDGSPSGLPPVRINEVSSENSIYVNELFKRNDWVELYNTTSEDIDVEGMYLSDNPDKPQKWQITSKSSKPNARVNTVIPAHGFLIIWCDKLEQVSQLHASFKLGSGKGDVCLTAADGSWTDQLTYDPMAGDQTAGRYPDGSDNVYTMNVPTIERANLTSSYVEPVSQPIVNGIHDLMAAAGNTLQVRYVVGSLVIRPAVEGTASGRSNLDITIINMAGQRVHSASATLSDGTVTVPLSSLGSGAYSAVVTDARGHRTVCKFIVGA
jgi:hypothetical protein